MLRTEERSLIHPWLHFRKLPGRNVYAQMHNEKEQEMTSPVSHSEDTQNIIQGEEFIDDDLDSQTLGNKAQGWRNSTIKGSRACCSTTASYYQYPT